MQKKSSAGGRAALIAVVIAVMLSEKLNASEENILGNLLTLVGASLLTIAAIEETEKENPAKDNLTTSNT